VSDYDIGAYNLAVL